MQSVEVLQGATDVQVVTLDGLDKTHTAIDQLSNTGHTSMNMGVCDTGALSGNEACSTEHKRFAIIPYNNIQMNIGQQTENLMKGSGCLCFKHPKSGVQ
jgi:hypothetical protein